MASPSTWHEASALRTTVVPTLLLVISLLICGSLWSAISWRARSRGHSLPPGPKPLPLIGNMLDMPPSKPWIGFRDLCDKYGDVVYLRFPNQPTIVLGSHKVISEVLEKRTANTSDRQVAPLIRLTSNEWAVAFLPYGQMWRIYRRSIWQHFHPGAIGKYAAAQNVVIRNFLHKLLVKPHLLKEHIRYTFAALILKIVYEIEVSKDRDTIIESMDTALEGFIEAIVPGRFLVDAIPLLQHIPAWVPGAGFQKKIKKWREASIELRNIPFSHRARTSGDDHDSAKSVVELLLEKLSADKSHDIDVEEVVKNVAAAAFGAGSDTSFSALLTMFLAMSLYPDVRRKAQAELDAIVGPNRLPEYSDRDSLVYINAIVKECLRWMNVSPLGFPHRTVQDDVLFGYFVPAGTLLLPNIWACMHDPEVYDDPDEFRPERFIRDGQLDPTRDPSEFVFGFGRRICPGRYFADASLFLNIACVLHVFDIGPPLDEYGEPIVVIPQMSDGPISYPEDYRCTVSPRSGAAASLILSAQAELA